MENIRYDFSPIIRRKPFKLPDQDRVAIWVVVNLEYFDIGLCTFARQAGAAHAPDVPNYSKRDYGPRVGIWRIMEVLEKHGVKATASVNSAVCQHYPAIIEEGKKRGMKFFLNGVNR